MLLLREHTGGMDVGIAGDFKYIAGILYLFTGHYAKIPVAIGNTQYATAFGTENEFFSGIHIYSSR